MSGVVNVGGGECRGGECRTILQVRLKKQKLEGKCEGAMVVGEGQKSSTKFHELSLHS